MRRVVAYPALGLGLLILLYCMGLALPLELVALLLGGWALFLARVAPGVTVDGGGVAIGLTCLVLFAAVAHSFFGWLYRQVWGPEGPGWSARWTGMLVAGVVLMFAAGITAAGMAHQVGWLLTSKDRWITSGPWPVVYRVQSVNNLKQVGLAISNHESQHGALPAGATLDAEGRLLHGWQAQILPNMEQLTLFPQVNFAVPWDDPANSTAIRTRVNAYINPGVRDQPDPLAPAPSHYAGNAWVLGGEAARKTREIPDGTSHTILAGEAAGSFRPWAYPANWRDPAKGINRSPEGFGGPSPGGANFLFADGSVKFLKNSIDPKVFRGLNTPAGSENIRPDDY